MFIYFASFLKNIFCTQKKRHIMTPAQQVIIIDKK